MPEISIGLYPDVGGSWVLPRLPGRAGLFLALTGASLNAADARFAGMADYTLRHEDHGTVLEAIAAARWQGEREADAAQLGHLLLQRSAGIELPASPLRAQLDRIDQTIGHDQLEDLAPRLAALANDPDPWLATAGAAFNKGSPMSAALGFEMQRRARHLSLAEVFRLEWQASVGCCLNHDFAEGVRALLVDKDKQPRWQPGSLADLTREMIDRHLQPHHTGPHPLADLA